MDCPFCHPENLDPIHEGELFITFRDKFPVSEGHTLIIPRRHCASFQDLTQEEKQELMVAIDRTVADLAYRHQPAAFNVGWNDGAQAGQTVFHFHAHVIPRYEGDVEDPRGGVRWVLPDRARYWRTDTP